MAHIQSGGRLTLNLDQPDRGCDDFQKACELDQL